MRGWNIGDAGPELLDCNQLRTHTYTHTYTQSFDFGTAVTQTQAHICPQSLCQCTHTHTYTRSLALPLSLGQMAILCALSQQMHQSINHRKDSGFNSFYMCYFCKGLRIIPLLKGSSVTTLSAELQTCPMHRKHSCIFRA